MASWPFHRVFVLLLALAYLAAHLPFLSPSLEDIDSINFALGLRDFDPALHQPHPPGYPVYIALGHVSLAFVRAIAPNLSPPSAEALALSIWSAIGGAAALLMAARFFSLLGTRRTALWATVLLACAPLFWLSGVRPMSDMTGLAIAMAAQALLLEAFVLDAPTRVVPGAVLAAVALGVRMQTIWLTLPLLLLAAFAHRPFDSLSLAQGRRRGATWLTIRFLVPYLIGVAVWAIPLLVATGGPQAYVLALSSQAGEDFAWVDMLWANPTPRQVAFGLVRTFVLPWGEIPLAASMLTAAAAGALLLLARERRTLLIVAVAFGPYAVFHLLFQDTTFVRYALPIIPAIAWLAARGLTAAGRWMPVLAAPLAAWAIVSAAPATAAYGREPHPAFRAIDDVARQAATTPPAALYAHFSLRRPLQAAEPANVRVVEPAHQYEWLGLVDYWRNGGTQPIWFLADPLRTDVTLFDPVSRVDVVRYRWAIDGRPELGGTRPLGVDWYRFATPGWFLAEGWSLTPETGGLARATAKGPDHAPIVGYVRRRREPMHLVVGGRHLAEGASPAAQLEMRLDDRVIDRWTLTVEDRNFLRFLDLPNGVPPGDGLYARLTISSQGVGTDGRVPVAVRQFDVQPATRLVHGFGIGWYEEESVTATGLRWRWTSDRSVLQVRGPEQPVQIRLRGENPLRYFDSAPKVRITAGERVIDELQPASDFEWTVTVPADAISAARGEIAVETNRVFVPAETEGTSDRRRLGLRIFECEVHAAR